MARGMLLVTGGAGYVGSHAVVELIARGYQVAVLDNFSQGHREAVAAGAELVVGDLADRDMLGRLFARRRFDGVLHFAANSLVGESWARPFRYLGDNVANAVNLVQAAAEAGVRKFVLSSTANLYGAPDRVPIPESAPVVPGSPYGESKLAVERLLAWTERTHGLRWATLRYFNAAGAHPDLPLGEDHRPETHLIPLVLEAALGQRPAIDVFGHDYPTPDGTCVRDYVHVCDLAAAHALVLDALDDASRCYNLGTGRGHSVQEVIAAAGAVTGRPIRTRAAPRRPGDPPALVASAERIRRELGWTPRFPELSDIIATAWAWKRAHPSGYPARAAAE